MILLKGLVLALMVYASLLALLWWGQERLLFHPDRLPANHPLALPADVHEVWLDVPGAKLHALHLRLPQPNGVVFFLHGNSGNVQSWFTNRDFYKSLNLDLFMIDYRGFGKSSGRIENEAQLQADVQAAWAHVAPQYAGKRQVLFGRSLGSGLAATLAVQVQPAMTILVSPYLSMAEVASDHYRWVPRSLLRYPLRTDLVIAGLKSPLLLVHGEQDTLIAASHSQRLKALAPQAQLLLLPRAGHNDLQSFEAYGAGLAAALTQP
jgi:uncharacterized protein